ncbi:MAG: HTTM domain-containing protein [Thermoleophilaceae bacterium]
MSVRALRPLRAHLFTDAPAARLAMLRILTAAWTLQYVGRRRRLFAQVARTDPSLFQPVGPMRALRRPLSPTSFRLLYGTTLAATVALLGGFRHRCSGPLFSGSLLCLLCYRNSWSMIYHNDNALVLHALTLAVSPSADAWSLDARSRADSRHDDADWRYGWPIQLMKAVTALTYFLAGVAKVKGPLGLAWASGDALRSQVAVDALRKELLGSTAAPLGARLYERVAIYRALAVGSLALELGAPLALVNGRLARFWAMNAFLMHWGIYFVMGIRFRYQLAGVMFASYFEPEQAVRRIARR